MDIEIRKADLSDLDRLMEWRMRVLAEVFFDDGIKDNEVLKKKQQILL